VGGIHSGRVVAFFAILFTGRYLRALFDVNTGVLRWSWRVAYYAYGTLGTDRYPPFTLADVPDYPARWELAYPERLSRGLVLVKWWLLAIPQLRARSAPGRPASALGQCGLIGLLTFTGAYPRSIFDLVVGLNRWVLRVAAYAAVLTDVYPPFRLDQGGLEAGTMR
jgi:hypothetical protein